MQLDPGFLSLLPYPSDYQYPSALPLLLVTSILIVDHTSCQAAEYDIFSEPESHLNNPVLAK